ncbi:hypothetical protein [Streptomyces sp. WAC06614]|uniref:hypothetical protein n=1 Tax=Streptomyces sp. WAC06614 TaxID=2487416 RepID=UPI000F793B40|nr:hypothetical protein [Streptomyces sp. WAC06614]RSS83227.1 hypothetical protein EF918_04240 [Streptomyces sp. WAC06614]
MNPQPRKSPEPARPAPDFAAAFHRRPTRGPRGLAPGRRVWTTLGVAAAASVPVALSLTLAGSGALDFGATHETAAVREMPDRVSEPTEVPAPPSVTAPAPTPSQQPVVQPTPQTAPKAEQPPTEPAAPAAPSRGAPPVNQVAPQAAPEPPAVAPDTAAGAVSRLAARQPGRHICYRAFVEGSGWQKPVCDGATAGTTGQAKRLKALNIATSGTKGTAANAYVHKEHWKTPWNSAADGIDLYIGSTDKDYPYMLGFVINVGDGAVCQNAHIRTHGWGGLACDKPLGQAAGNYIFGGTLSDSLWLEAVRFTV